MIRVVDAIMGSGKTSAAIQYINDHPDRKFLYITPFIDETERIKRSCRELRFETPSDSLSSYGNRKGIHLKSLVRAGKNIATTHALFTQCDGEAIQLIADAGYVVFIDEVIDVITPVNILADDLRVLVESGILIDRKESADATCGRIEVAPDKEYDSKLFRNVFDLAKTGRLTYSRIGDRGEYRFYTWTLSPELFTLSDEIYVLTYLFDGMPMKAFLDVHGIEYEYIGAGLCRDGHYRFLRKSILPDGIAELGDKIHICEHRKLNSIGDAPTALSASWTKSAVSSGEIDTLRKNYINFFRHLCPEWIKPNQRLWSTFKLAEGRVRDRGFNNCNLAWNCRATNAYQNCVALAYGVNIYLNPSVQLYFERNGARIDADKYALANMVQWIFRSAIRRGEEIWLYVPSSRMRGLLKKWLADLRRAGTNRGDNNG